MDLLQLSQQEPKPSRKADKTVLLILSIASAIAAIVGALKGSPRWLLIGFFACTAIALLAAFIIPPLRSEWQLWQNKRKDDDAIHAAMPRLRLLADDFCQFVRASSGETLHYIALNILCKGDRIAQAKLQMPPMELWTGLITNFKT